MRTIVHTVYTTEHTFYSIFYVEDCLERDLPDRMPPPPEYAGGGSKSKIPSLGGREEGSWVEK